MDSIYQVVADLERQNQQGALCTVVRSRGATPRRASSKMLVYPGGNILGTIGGGEMERRVIAEALQAMRDGKPRLVEYSLSEPQRGDPGVCGGQMEIYVEPIQPIPTLLVVGGGHVGKAVAHLAHWLGFRVVVNDDRPEFCTPDAVPDADEYYPVSLPELTSRLEITSSYYIVLTTRSIDIDVPGLPSLLETPAAYLGVIGSKRRWATTRQKLVELGTPESKLQGIHSPMGLDLHAETPEEIAVSIMAEVITVYRAKNPLPKSP